MRRSGGRPGARSEDRSTRAVAISEGAYRALLRAYPEGVRAGYGREMARCFGDLCRREAAGRGLPGLVLLWARVLPELLWTALKERAAADRDAPRAPLPTGPVAKAAGLSALLGGLAGAAYPAYFLTAAPAIDALSPPGYYGYWAEQVGYALSLLLVFPAMALCSLGLLLGVYAPLAGRPRGPGALARAGCVLSGVAVVSFFSLAALDAARVTVSGLEAGMDFYSRTLWEQRLWELLSTAGTLGWILGPLALGAAAFAARVFPGRLRALPLGAPLALFGVTLASAFGFGAVGGGHGLYLAGTLCWMLPYVAFAVLGLVMVRGRTGGDGRGTIAAAGATGSGGPARRGASADRGVASAGSVRSDQATAGAAREKELLGALVASRVGLTAAEAAVETSLTVEEADAMLSALAAKGHVEVRVERGRILYALW